MVFAIIFYVQGKARYEIALSYFRIFSIFMTLLESSFLFM
jgi:hypothetical protein